MKNTVQHLDYKCGDCGKELENAKAYAGHLRLAHMKRSGWKWEMEEKMRHLTEVNTYTIRALKQVKALADAGNVMGLCQALRDVKTDF